MKPAKVNVKSAKQKPFSLLVKKLNYRINRLWCRFHVEFGLKRLVPRNHYFGLYKGYKCYRWACVSVDKN